jgi:outer membrane receptor for ferric coprogen and ferric-rhodotorulic acid
MSCLPATGPRPAARCLSVVAAACGVLASAPDAAHAQTAAPTGPASAASSPAATASAPAETTLPAVRVRATGDSDKTEGSGSYAPARSSTSTGLKLAPRDTPQSVSVITREQIDDQGLRTVADALSNSPGVSVKAVDRGRNTLVVRGFDVNNFQFDGIPFATGNIGLEELSTAIYDRVEVVRGATGLLSGFGDPSAAVNLVRKRADSKTFTGSASVELGSWKHRAGTVDLSTPLNADGSLRARVVSHAYSQDAFIDLEHSRGSVLFATMEADLTPATRLTLGASDQRDERRGVLWFPLPLWYSDGTRTDWPRNFTSATRWNRWDTNEQTAFARLEHTLPSRWTLRADASWRRQDEDSMMLWLDGTPDRNTGLGLTAYPYHYHADPRQLHLAFSANGPFEAFGRSHEAALGVTRSRLSDSWTNREPVAAVLPPVGDFNAWDGSYPEPAMGPAFLGSAGTTTEYAAYGVTRLQLTDALKLIAGARVSNWQRDEQAGAWTPAAYTIEHNGVVTPYAGLVLDLSKSLSVYTSFTTIFKPQSQRKVDGSYVEPLDGKSHELGLKGEFLDGRLHASTALFRTDQDNFAVPDGSNTVVGRGSEQAYIEAKGTRSQGWELEIVGQITSQWNLAASWTQFSAKDAQGAHVNSHHPRKQLKLSTHAELPAVLSGLSVGGALRWEDQPPKVQTNPVGVQQETGQPAFAVVDLGARYAIDRHWSLQVNVNNVFDKHYRTSSAWWDGALYGEPRNVTLTAKYQF